MAIAQRAAAVVDGLEAAAYMVPTEEPESDGTLAWDATTIVVVHAEAGGERGLGYTYGHAAVAHVVRDVLAEAVEGVDAFAVGAAWRAMAEAVRNLGRPGIAAGAISAVDAALWDLKARLLDVPLAGLLGGARDSVPLYGSGGFTSYSDDELQRHMADFVQEGLTRVKMKVGREAGRDPERVRAVRESVGPDVELYVDANGAYSRKQALALAGEFAELGVRWFEEPVSSDDLEGLRLLRDRAPAGMDVAAGEYGYTLDYFRRMLEAGAVDCLQADGTRCEGVTGFLDVAALCRSHGLELSAHTAPQLHVHVCCGVQGLRHLEWFHDHVRMERMLFDGVLEPVDGALEPDLSRPGNGLELKRADAARYAA